MGPAPKQILVVDDDAQNRALLTAFLTPAHEVVQASGGLEALALLERRPTINLVLLDLVMPGLDGLEVCRRLKKLSADRFLPVILLTGHADQEHRNAALEAGADDFLGKPFDRRELLLRVRAFLRLHDQDAQIRAQDEQLRAQLQDLQQLQSLKDELFSLIVHDVRNPLTGVIGFVDLLRNLLPESDTRLRNYAAKALEGARKVEEVLGSVLEVQRLESGEWVLQRASTHLRGVIEDAIESISGAASACDVNLVLDAETDPTLLVDRALVRRSIENLLANAVKYSPRGTAVDVTVREDADTVEVVVADRGPGIPEPLKGVLFQKFGSVEARCGRARRGHGLGLHLVKLVASAHGGSVAARDRTGGGSDFVLRLPRSTTLEPTGA
jgi:two-component system sensor histidine kinase/response regulator